jgi:hypothetical protein
MICGGNISEVIATPAVLLRKAKQLGEAIHTETASPSAGLAMTDKDSE